MRPTTIASIPSGHPYVGHLDAPDTPLDAPLDAPLDDRAHRLPDPDPSDPTRAARGPWWPAVMLEAAWVREHAGTFDLMHVHFGFDHRTPAQLRELVAALFLAGRPLVLTVHDLRSPHQEDPAVLAAQLDVLVPAAQELLTLTDAAADEVEQRWGRRPVVAPHPHVVDLDLMDAVRRRRTTSASESAHVGVAKLGAAQIGMALKNLRTNVDAVRLLPALARLSDRGHRVEVTLHREALAQTSARAYEAVEALRHAAARGEIELVVHDPRSDADLWSWVAGLDVAVLPYRFGTHSGWLEMCHDLGTSVVAPAVGHYAAQGADATYDVDPAHLDDALVTAVHSALRARTLALPGLDAEARRRQRQVVAATHQRVYASVLGARAGAA